MTKVSTITPCYNMGRYIKGFLDNLSTQTHKDLEVILDHNDPTEAEVKLVEDYNDKYDNIFHIQVEGVDPIGISMNRCIENASGDYLCIWNVDDLRTPDSIEMMAKALDDNSDVDFLYGNNTHADSVESRFGTGNDLRISHDGTTNHIKGTGSHATMFWTSNVERWYIDSNGHFKPGANGNYDIGASNARVRNAYISDLKLSNEGQSNDVDGTWGDWTLQEGKDKVYMINNRTGKKYSLKMEEE